LGEFHKAPLALLLAKRLHSCLRLTAPPSSPLTSRVASRALTRLPPSTDSSNSFMSPGPPGDLRGGLQDHPRLCALLIPQTRPAPSSSGRECPSASSASLVSRNLADRLDAQGPPSSRRLRRLRGVVIESPLVAGLVGLCRLSRRRVRATSSASTSWPSRRAFSNLASHSSQSAARIRASPSTETTPELPPA